MPHPKALSPEQEALVRERVRRGADISSLEHLAKTKGWGVSRATLARLMKAERERPHGPAVGPK